MTSKLGSALAIWLSAASASAAGFTIESGASVALGAGTLAAGCADVVIAGTLDVASGTLDGARRLTVSPGGTLLGGSGTLRVAGPWSNSGTFAAGTGSVELVDGCAVTDASIAGDNTFANLAANTATGKTLTFAAGSTQTITGVLRLTGAPGNRLRIRSSVNGAEAFIDLLGGQAVASVDVKDNHAVGAPIVLGTDSVLGGNTPGWQLAAAIPALPAAAAAGLAAWLLASVARRCGR
jgi:hypothetical protein